MRLSPSSGLGVGLDGGVGVGVFWCLDCRLVGGLGIFACGLGVSPPSAATGSTSSSAASSSSSAASSAAAEATAAIAASFTSSMWPA